MDRSRLFRGLPAAFRLAAALPALLVALAVPAALTLAAPDRAEPPLPSLPSATRGPAALAFGPDGRLYVAESDTGTVAVVDPATRRVVRRWSTGGREPAAVSPVGPDRLLVANRLDGSVALMSATDGRALARTELRGEPSGIAVEPDGRRAFVALAQVDQVAVLALPGLDEQGRIAVGRRPSSLLFVPGGRAGGPLLLAGNQQEGSVSLIDPVSLGEQRRIPITGVNLRGLCLSPSAPRVFATGQIAANDRVTREPLDIWTNTVFALDLRPQAVPDGHQARASAEGWIDFSGAPAPDPDGIVALGPDHVAVALAGSDEVVRIRTPGPFLRSYDPVVERRARVGLRPRALALAPDGRELWVANEVGSDLACLDPVTLAIRARVSLGAPDQPDPRLMGRYLFGSASLAAGGQFTCASCHPDGRMDGLDWEFVHVPDQVRRRNTRSLRGGLGETAPFRWSGHERTLESFLHDEVTGLLGGPPPGPQRLAALRRFLEGLELPPNPYRPASGEHSPEALEGKSLFEGRAGCSGCHAGPRLGGTGLQAWVGTTAPDRPLDVPHLMGVADTGPWLHDGRAKTLEAVLTSANPEQRHGLAHELTDRERRAILRYLKEL